MDVGSPVNETATMVVQTPSPPISDEIPTWGWIVAGAIGALVLVAGMLAILSQYFHTASKSAGDDGDLSPNLHMELVEAGVIREPKCLPPSSPANSHSPSNSPGPSVVTAASSPLTPVKPDPVLKEKSILYQRDDKQQSRAESNLNPSSTPSVGTPSSAAHQPPPRTCPSPSSSHKAQPLSPRKELHSSIPVTNPEAAATEGARKAVRSPSAAAAPAKLNGEGKGAEGRGDSPTTLPSPLSKTIPPVASTWIKRRKATCREAPVPKSPRTPDGYVRNPSITTPADNVIVTPDWGLRHKRSFNSSTASKLESSQGHSSTLTSSPMSPCGESTQFPTGRRHTRDIPHWGEKSQPSTIAPSSPPILTQAGRRHQRERNSPQADVPGATIPAVSLRLPDAAG
eukprot:Sspe_Gene.18106::Locus_6481_Transcript_1_1_Confidence_1.000_Length_1469::g.18106::m.18106